MAKMLKPTAPAHLREAWERAIVDSGVTRFLYATTNTEMRRPSAGLLAKEEVKAFLGSLRSKRHDRALLAALYFLLQDDLESFLRDELSELLRSSSRVSSARPRIARGGVRGKLDAQRTVELQASGRLDHASFAVRVPEADLDTPENRLLKLLLAGIADAFRRVARVAGSGTLLDHLEEGRRAVEAALSGPYLSGVADARRVTPVMTHRAVERRLHRGYHTAAALAKTWQSMNSGPRSATLIRLVASGWLAPLDDNDLFELYVLVQTIQILVNQMGFRAQDYGLIRRGRGAVAHLVHTNNAGEESTATVYFDQTVDSVARAVVSRFPTLVRRYEGITGRSRRPDVAVVLRSPGGATHTLLIEAKRSSDEGYVRQSIYKMFAYLHDFAALWRDRTVDAPKLVLVFPNDFPFKSGQTADPDLIIASGGDPRRLEDALRSALPQAANP
jgi:hypothetical protein